MNDPAKPVRGPSAKTKPPAVSIIVPVYNVADHVGAAIESLKAQTFEDFEAIIVDDGSTDASYERARRAAKNDPRFIFLQQTNAGLSAARNAGLAAARGRVVGFLDGDDSFASEFIGALMWVLSESHAPWAACAVEIVSDDKTEVASAMHGVAHPATDKPWAANYLEDWPNAMLHWPSAWNKLYRRDLIAGLTFPEGLAYEDHVWFQRAAERAPVLAYLPRPLYRHTRGRVGQITSDGSDRVFQQFDILDKVEAGLAASHKPRAQEGLARLATRTFHERAATLRDRARRAKFVEAARAWFEERNLVWSPEWDRSISRSFADVLQGRIPLSVVIATDGTGPGLERSLRSIAGQYLVDVEVLIVPTAPGLEVQDRLREQARHAPTARVLSGGTGSVSEARNRGLGAARGIFTAVLDAGDWYEPGALWLWVEAMIRERADLGLTRFSQAAGHLHPGTHDGRDPFGGTWPHQVGALERDWLEMIEGTARRLPSDRCLALHPHPSAKIFRTAFLRANGLDFGQEPLGSWSLTLRAALAATRVVAVPALGTHLSDSPIDRRLWRARHAPAALHAALMAMAPTLDAHLPRDEWYPRLMSRALWEKASFADFPTGNAKHAFMQDARALVRETCLGPASEADFDPFINASIKELFEAPAAVSG